jgi:hypothetical protein
MTKRGRNTTKKRQRQLARIRRACDRLKAAMDAADLNDEERLWGPFGLHDVKEWIWLLQHDALKGGA